MTHAKYNSLFMNVSSRPNSVERPVSVERPTQRPASAGQHLVGERPGKGGVAGQQRGNLPIPGQQGQMRLSRPVGQPVRKSQGLWAASERQGGGEDDIEVVKEVEAGELKKQRVKDLTIKDKKRADFAPCSPFCPGVTGIPELECTQCHSLFHPKCVSIPAWQVATIQATFKCKVIYLQESLYFKKHI